MNKYHVSLKVFHVYFQVLTSHEYRQVQKMIDLYVPTSKIEHVNIFLYLLQNFVLKNSFKSMAILS